MEIFWQSCFIRAKVVEFGQKLLYSGKNGFIRKKVVVFEQNGCIGKSFYVRAKEVVFGQMWM